jgi:hypothetical protein
MDTLRPKAPAAEEGKVAGSSGKSIRTQHCIHSASKMPSSFTSNSAKEERLLSYLRDFQRVFQELYPHR